MYVEYVLEASNNPQIFNGYMPGF